MEILRQPVTGPDAYAVPALSALASLLCVPPLIWHIQNRNIAATSLIIWLMLTNLMYLVNAIIWPRDNFGNDLNEYRGSGFCDVQVRLKIGASVGIPGAVLCIVRELAQVLNTSSVHALSSITKQRSTITLEYLMTWGWPFAVMAFYYVVQPARYFIYTIEGCTPVIDMSWLAFVLVLLWPVVILTAASYYSGLILLRIARYRRSFISILRSSSTTRGQFVRLAIISITTILVDLPIQLLYLQYMIAQVGGLHPFNWHYVHTNWTVIRMARSGSYPHSAPYVHVFFSFLVFAIFGTGKEARTQYKRCLIRMHVDKVFPGFSAARPRRTASTLLTTLTTTRGLFGTFRRKSLSTSSTSTTDIELGKPASLEGETSIFGQPLTRQHPQPPDATATLGKRRWSMGDRPSRCFTRGPRSSFTKQPKAHQRGVENPMNAPSDRLGLGIYVANGES